MKNRHITVLMHDSVSLDGSFINFDFAPEMMGLHYEIAGEFGPATRLFGSQTARASIEMFGGFEPESPDDLQRPEKADSLSYWVVVDSRGILKDQLHYFRRSEYCRDVAVLASESTPAAYLNYLATRHYDHFISGEDRVDLERALEWMADRYGTDTIVVDSGSRLTNAMLNRGLIHQISLLTLPIIVGCNAENLFAMVERPVKLSLIKQRAYPGGYVWSLYEVEDRV